MPTTTLNFVTFGELVEQTGARREHFVRQSLNRLKVQPIRRAGSAFLYPPEAVERVRDELRRRGELRETHDDVSKDA